MRMAGRYIILLALGHGLNDGLAGYLLGTFARSNAPVLQIAIGLLLYNILAFGGQYPVALWLEKRRDHKSALQIAYGMNVLAVLLSFIHYPLSILLAGIASAIYHVAGGAICAREGNAAPIGLFAAPGVAGLAAGGYFAWAGYDLQWMIAGISLLFFASLFFIPREENAGMNSAAHAGTDKFHIDRHDIIMILLLTVIAMRSLVWNIFQLIHENNYRWLIAIAVSAALGKVIGGWVADRIGWRLYIMLSLGAATPLISFFRNEILLFCIGVGLLQSGIPASTALLVRSLRGQTEKGVALSFGTAIIAGALVFYTPARNLLTNNAMIWVMVLLMIGLMAWARPQKVPEGSL